MKISIQRNIMGIGSMLLLLMILSVSHDLEAQQLTEQIRLNQVGFYPKAPKEAVVMEDVSGNFYLTSTDLQDTVYTGTIGEKRTSPFSSKVSRLVNFSDFQNKGAYVIAIPGLGHSHPFEVGNHVMKGVADGSIKAFYLIRSSTDLPAEYAGKWARAAGTPDTEVRVHGSAATDKRPEGTIISSPKGWYDAGDYNKYIVNSGITTATLLSLYEDFPAYMDTVDTHIPESSNDIPDLLDEILWNARWMLTMQDPNDGGVYHKLTFARFSAFIMPNQATSNRYVVQKSTQATLDFAAVMAQTARLVEPFEQQLPGLADSCLTAAKAAWQWAQQHPNQRYSQSQVNNNYDPDIETGEYGDWNASDEFKWAASELYITTGDEAYWNAQDIITDDNLSIPGWGNVRMLGYYSLIRNQDALSDAAKSEVENLKQRLVSFADQLLQGAEKSSYDTPMGNDAGDFYWGSNSGAANEGILLIQAYRLTQDNKYLDGAMANLDYLLGRNGTGYSFVTGYGDKTPMHIHHRPSGADGIADPVPGLIAGGPNPEQQDGCSYPSDEPDESYVDTQCSYASNEIAINWNAPLVYLAQAVENLAGNKEYSAIHFDSTLPDRFELKQNYPNPFNPSTTIAYELSNDARVNLDVFNMLGQKVSALVDRRQAAGRYQVDFSSGNLSSGLYLYRLVADNRTQTRKMMLMK